MPINIEKIARAHGWDFVTEGVKQARPGWVQFRCPFPSCASSGYTLGFNIGAAYFNCYRCGWHAISDVFVAYGVNTQDIGPLIRSHFDPNTSVRTSAVQPVSEHVLLPKTARKCLKTHISYIQQRKLHATTTISLWQLLGTSAYDKKYPQRIVAPITLDNRLVSFQTRDITGRSKRPYLTCPKSNEVVHHKHTLYGVDSVPGNTVIVCEGIVDVWKLGPGAVATFGVGFKLEQVAMLATRFKKIVIAYDPDPAGKIGAEKLGCELDLFDVDVSVMLNLPCDAGDMTEKQKRKFLKHAIGK